MSRRVAVIAVIALALALVVGVGAAAQAQLVQPPLPVVDEPDEAGAQAAYDAASKLAQRRNFKAARDEAEAAMRKAPTAQRAALLAAIDIELDRPRAALEAILIALDLDEAFTMDAYLGKRLAALRPFAPNDLGVVRLQADPPDVRCSDVDSGEPFVLGARRTAIAVATGARTFRCTAAGYEPGDVAVMVRARTIVSVSLKLARAVAAPQGPDGPGGPGGPGVQKELETSSSSGVATALIISGGVLLGAGVGFHLWGLEAVDRADAARDDAGADWDAARLRYDAAVDDLTLRSSLAYAGYLLGAAALTTGIVLVVTEDEPAVVVVPLVTPELGGAACALSF